MSTNDSENAIKNRLFVLDSYGLIYRAYFAFVTRPLLNEKGENVSAVMGFFRNIANVLRDYKPGSFVAAFDSRTPTFRHEMYPEYKANRDAAPQDLHAQVPVIEDILAALGIPALRVDGYEADDIIATLAAECDRRGIECRVLTGDKDLMQLVNDNTWVMKPNKEGGWKDIDDAGVMEEWGCRPDQMLDMLSLIGDTSDNVPGIKGVGEKTAAKLLSLYQTLDGIFENADDIKGAMGQKVRDGRDTAYTARELIKLKYDAPIEFDLEAFTTSNLNYTAAAEKLTAAGVPSVAKLYAGMSGKREGAGSASNPGSLIRNAVSSGEVEGDFPHKVQAAVEESETEAIIPPQPNHGDYKAITDLNELKAYIDACIAAGTAGFDTETDTLVARSAHMAGFSLSHTAGTGVYVPLRLTNALLGPELISEQAALTELSRLFAAPGMTIAMHNAKFDLQVLHAAGLDLLRPMAAGLLKCRIVDTMIAAWLISSDKTEGTGKSSYSLEKLAETKLHLTGTEYDAIVPKGGIFADLDLETATPYAAEDADFTLALWNLFAPQLESAKLTQLFTTVEMPVLPILALMELEGIRITKEALDSYKTELTAQIAVTEKQIYELAGEEFNIASPKQLGTILFEKLGLKAGKKTKTGYSTDTNVLEDLRNDHPIAGKILEYRSLTKLLSTYVETLPAMTDENSRIHTSFMQTGTATGRLSSRDPNLQNIPVRDEAGRRIRSAFVAPEGRSLVSADYSQIELVILAHLSEDTNMCAAFNGGTDIHRATAALLFGVEPAAVTPDMRRTAKTINFGVIYGMSAFRLSNELGIPRSTAQNFITTYFATYSGINAFKQETIRKAEETGSVETILGRRRTITNINSRNAVVKQGAERMAVNTPIQGSAADIVKLAMIEVYRALLRGFPTARMLLQVHDEIIVECDEKDAPAVAELMQRTMESIAQLNVPLRVSTEYGKAWGEFH